MDKSLKKIYEKYLGQELDKYRNIPVIINGVEKVKPAGKVTKKKVKSEKEFTRDYIVEHIELIKRIFQVDRYPEESGGCLKFHLYLQKFYICDGWYDTNHIVTEIDGKFYDISGETTKPPGAYKLSGEHYKTLKRQFKHLLSEEDKKLLKKHYKKLF